MRKAEFNVHPQVIVEFTDELTERDLINSLIGTTEDGEVIIEIEYEKNESKLVDEMEEILERLSEEIDDNEDDE